MHKTCIIFLRDPLMALDVAEIIAESITDVKIASPATAAEAIAALDGAICCVMDQAGAESLRQALPQNTIPTIYVASTPPTTPTAHEVYLKEPFTNKSFHTALVALGLMPSRAAE